MIGGPPAGAAPFTTPDAPRPRPPGGPYLTAPDPPRPVRDDGLARARALLIARLAISLYLVELLFNLVRPQVLPDEPLLSVFQKSPFEKAPGPAASFDKLLSMPRAVFWAVLAGIVAGVLIQVLVAVTRPQGRRATTLTWATLAVLLGPFGLISLSVLVVYPLQALICLPSTALVLWLLHIGQRFARVPVAMLLIAFGWGALIVFGLGRAYSNLAFGSIYGHLVKGAGTDLTQMTRARYRAMDLLLLHMSVLNALIVAAGVLLLMLLFRHRVSDAMTGLVLGAAVGLGYNFVESALLIKIYGTLGGITGTTGGFEYWIRQSVGLLGGQVTFGALLGAGLGLAFQARDPGRRRLIAGAALAASIGGAAATETLAGWFSRLTQDLVPAGSTFDTLIASPFLWLLPQTPFFVVTVLLLVTARRARAAAARTAVAAEAAAGPAITRAEVPFLIDPALRFWTLVSTWRTHGKNTALALRRLQAAQLDLAGCRLWLQQPGVADDPAAREEVNRLGNKVMELKNTAGTGPGVTR